ncbi:hypothetical protein Tco_0956142 [Tanacetum coccineum]|uniref:Uncharacterized protein n=1 Tax=Tanacetum coccineum TaxID=301880 RepID=A0ABQ5EA13_9ASTR
MVKRDVELRECDECSNEIDKLAELTDEMQLKQEDQGCVHASNELQLHVVHVVAGRVFKNYRCSNVETAPRASLNVIFIE